MALPCGYIMRNHSRILFVLEFLNKAGEVSYWFAYHLQAAGWRACWISFEYMQGDKKDKDIVAYRLVAPQRKGRIFLDRLIFPEKKMNLRTTPDQQLPLIMAWLIVTSGIGAQYGNGNNCRMISPWLPN